MNKIFQLHYLNYTYTKPADWLENYYKSNLIASKIREEKKSLILIVE